MKREQTINVINDYLKAQYGEVKPEWQPLIVLLGDNIDLYKRCQESIDEFGIYDPETGKKNPLLTTVKDLQATIMKQIQHLGLSPWAASKIKQEAEDDTDDFITALTQE